jgi:polyribonucleotide nucleotidyltransferase
MKAISHLVRDQISIPVGDIDLEIIVGPFAELANQSLICRYGDTEVLVAVTMSKDIREGLDFFPLVVNFEEKMYAAGKIPGGFIKKEGRPTETSILTSRAIDRPIRPLFPDGLRNEVQIVVLTLCADQKNPPDIPSMVGTGAALLLSDVPFTEALAAVRVGMDNGEFVANPTFQLIDESPLDLTVCASKDRILMLEAGAHEVSEDIMVNAIEFALDHIRTVIAGIEELRERIGKEKIAIEEPPEPSDELVRVVESVLDAGWPALVGLTKKKERDLIIQGYKDACITERFGEEKEEWTPEELVEAKAIGNLVEDGIKKRMRRRILDEGMRIDNRSPEDIRPIWAEVSAVPRMHGSAIFTRGETQAMTIATLGAIGDKQRLDDIGVMEYKRYMHHYYAPPFCYGETGFMRGPGRREIGHGALAEKALRRMIPEEEEFPYTIRLVTEILSSNGSTSMASVCGSTMSLMDAGVPISEPVAGVAMGLITDKDTGRFTVLSDLMGMEDHYGDMDFKVAGSRNGITAVQMDTKINGLTMEMVRDTFERARVGREFILGKMLDVIAEPRPELSPYAPRIITVMIDPEKIGDVIGPGGKIVRGIIEKTGVEIDIEDDGRVYITSTDAESSERAVQMIQEIVKEPEIGEEYEGRVVKIAQFGAFVRLTPSKDGLLHVSQICDRRVEKVEDCLRVGDTVRVRVQDIDEESGKISLTRRGLEFPDGDPLLERLKQSESGRSGGGRSGGRSGGGRSGGSRRPPIRDRDDRGSRSDRGGRDRGGRSDRDRRDNRDRRDDRDRGNRR